MRYADNCCSYTEIYHPTHQYAFTGPCIDCKQEQTVLVAAPELYAYRTGVSIQSALSNNADEREFLMSGICPACWNKTFGSEDDDESLEKFMDPDCLNPECDFCGETLLDCECDEI